MTGALGTLSGNPSVEGLAKVSGCLAVPDHLGTAPVLGPSAFGLQLFEALKKAPKKIADLWLMLFYTGNRQRETLKMEWS